MIMMIMMTMMPIKRMIKLLQAKLRKPEAIDM